MATADTSPAAQARMAALRAEADQLAATPEVGRAEVERLAAILDEMCEIAGIDRTPRRYWHGPGRAVDWVPPSLLDRYVTRRR